MTTDITCATCTNEPPFECFDDCLRCTAAAIAARPAAWASNRKWYLSTPWIATLEREVERQASAMREVAA